MARTPDADVARTEKVLVRFTPAEMERIDRQRGGLSRPAYLRALLGVHRASGVVLDRPQPEGTPGRHLHRYKVAEEAEPIRYEQGRPVWLAFCECGNHTLVERKT